MRRMKLIFGMIFLFLAGCAGLQPIADVDRTFEKVFEAPGYSTEQIFNGTKIWIAENFRSSKAVLEYENKDAGTIIGNGMITYPCKGLMCVGMKLTFTMRVDIKDQKFRLTFSNLYIVWPPQQNKPADGPIGTQRALDTVKPELLKFGDQILASFRKDKGKSEW